VKRTLTIALIPLLAFALASCSGEARTPAPSSAARPPIPATTVSTVVTSATTVTAVATPVPSRTPAPKTTTSSRSRAACVKDESQCFDPETGVKCETGSCVNAARGLTGNDVKRQTEEWLRNNPGYCAVGSTGAVAPCDD
jgi:hypothetical protein